MAFIDTVLALTSKIPKGKVTTYKIIAEQLDSKAYRAVGQALKCNPHAPRIPCHRVVASDGSLGGYSGKWNNPKKVKLLRKEGVVITDNKIDLRRFLYCF